MNSTDNLHQAWQAKRAHAKALYAEWSDMLIPYGRGELTQDQKDVVNLFGNVVSETYAQARALRTAYFNAVKG